MNRIWMFLFDRRVIACVGLAALVVFLFAGSSTIELGSIYAAIALGLALLVALVVWAVRRRQARHAARELEHALEAQAARAQAAEPNESQAQVALLRERLLAAIRTVKTSRLGETTGAAALYELPWYMVIGNPAAGKSTAIVESGLEFPLPGGSDSPIVQGVAGTRNCDWFFTSEGILLDTAGRYSVQQEDRGEWLDFLAQLKKHRSRAPINGILIAASLAELSRATPDAAIRLARSLRQRVHELTERLAVFCPVYLIFTKADLIAGFADFFQDCDEAERDRVWGATLAYAPDAGVDAATQFDKHFCELHDGLKALAVARMSLHRGQSLSPSVLTFPLEFAALRPALRSFVATLFDDNPYQFRPIFRGFYFTSAIQEGAASTRASERVAQRFALTPLAGQREASAAPGNGYFLKDLFTRVVFADRQLVKQYASRGSLRRRGLAFAAAAGTLALALGGWAWAYRGNRQLAVEVRADLNRAVALQQQRVDLGSRFEALELLQDRIEQLRRDRDHRPLGMGWGLYQGDAIEQALREAYFDGVRQVMLQPVGRSIEIYLAELNRNAAKLQPMIRPPASGAAPLDSRFGEASSESGADGYNALKTYLMLADRSRMEPGHLADQLTRFWRGWLEAHRGAMPREQMMRSAERMLAFSVDNLRDPAFPALKGNLTLIEQTRANLHRVVRGMSARERVYAEIKARVANQYAPVTVARIVGEAGRGSVTGSYAVSGAFTRRAWIDKIEPAFKVAARSESQSADWVLDTRAQDDLSLEGSPEQVRKALTDLYKAEYVREWQRFVQGIEVAEFASFDDAVMQMNLLGDAGNSPIGNLMTALFDETSWDNPNPLNQQVGTLQAGLIDRLQQKLAGAVASPAELKLDLKTDKLEVPMGPVGREFAGLGRIVMPRGDDRPLLAGYLAALGKIRSRLNQMKTQGDPGPGARQLMASTLEGGASEFAEALGFIDEQMLIGMSDGARSSLRPLLVQPLLRSFAAIVGPAEKEVNRLWAAQVRELFERTLAGKYPFAAQARVEATPQEIARIFGPGGAVAAFADKGLGSLVHRRGDEITPSTWATVGLRLRPEFSGGFAGWVAPLEGAAGAAIGGAAQSPGIAGEPAGQAAPAPGPAAQTAFQVLPLGSPGLIEYTLQIDGQTLRYRNAAAAWTDFVWPHPGNAPGVRISGVTTAGQTVEIVDEPGRFGLTRLFEAARRKKLADGSNELSWARDGQTVSVQLRVISEPGATPRATVAGAGEGPAVAGSGLKGLRLPAFVVGVDVPSTASASASAAPSSDRGAVK